MPGIADSSGPSYISSHSADVILSDIRPIKLQIEALYSINILLDEFLYNILSTARSLSTNKLRTSLLSLLPTNLGKEALLEAEVELRAYWDRTTPRGPSAPPMEDDSKSFSLQLAYELMRLKCQAYSTLNESDEDTDAESRIQEMMGQSIPKAYYLAPAALYLTAILEAVCEHILSDVGRVASRDSSRTSATIHDLFVALCEDESIYGLFKSMKVYIQIENLSKPPKSRRSKSISRSDKTSHSRTASPHHDVSPTRDSFPSSPPPRSRLSLEAQSMTTMTATTSASTSGSRSSFDKNRAMKIFMSNSRSSLERDGGSQNSHKKSDATSNEERRQSSSPHDEEFPVIEDTVMAAEFDNLMRSDSTMKVSLTPDRLRTMEMYKQEKDQRGTRRPSPLLFKSETDPVPTASRANPRRSSLLHVDSIVEDEEENPPPDPIVKPSLVHTRKLSVTTRPTPSLAATAASRVRSLSTSSQGPRNLIRKATRSNASISSSPPLPATAMAQGPDRNAYKAQNSNGFPPRTRRIQQNRESIDLDDVMGGFDEDDAAAVAKSPAAKPKGPYVSPSTRELIDFLAEGPPDTNFLTEGPAHNNSSMLSVDSGKPKVSGRLQRMMSKLSLGGSEKSRGLTDELSRSTSLKPIVTPIRKLPSKSSIGNLYLANRPTPPRPRPMSPPPSPPSSEDIHNPIARARARSVSQKPIPDWDPKATQAPPTPAPSVGRSKGDNQERTTPKAPRPVTTIVTATKPNETDSTAQTPIAPPTAQHASSPKSSESRQPTIRKPVPASMPTPSPSPSRLTHDDARDMHHMFTKATSVDECRIILDMFLAKSGIPLTTTDIPPPVPLSSNTPSSPSTQMTANDLFLENSLVELLLSDDVSQLAVHKHTKKLKAKVETETIPPSKVSSQSANGTLLDTESAPITQRYTQMRVLEVGA